MLLGGVLAVLLNYFIQGLLECGEPPVVVAGFSGVDVVDEVEFALGVCDVIDFGVVPKIDYGDLPFVLDFEK